MVFSSFSFIFLFFPLFLGGYFLAPDKLKNLIALIASYLFYTMGAPQVVIILFLGSLADYYISQYFKNKNGKTFFVLGIMLNVLTLVYFKYANFFVEQANVFLGGLGFSELSWVEVALPAGISFFTFQKISYLADVYGNRCKPASSLINYLLFVAFFPQLIAGPIVRYHDVSSQIEKRSHNAELFFDGFGRFSLGLAKKVLIADAMGRVAANVFELFEAGQPVPGWIAWLGITAYAFQIYFDFSAYSDMAIGIARMVGIRFLENFNFPYISQTITEFWRRWHISLSNWMKEYLYIPLGGNRVGTAKTYRNLVIVFLLSGLWHGANWTFIFWGAYHGFFLVLDRLCWSQIATRIWKPVNIAITFVIVLVGWVFFRSPDIATAGAYLSVMFNPIGFFNTHPTLYRAALIDNRELFFFVLAAACSFLPAISPVAVLVRGERLNFSTPRILFQGTATVVLFLLSVVTISGTRFSPFLYFEF